jgi:16S rRNA (uracil1498-N3)-methyltransferase
MAPRLYLPEPLQAGADVVLPPGPSRHAQVLRLQPGDAVTLFNGTGGEWSAEVASIGRSAVAVRIGSHAAVDRELAVRVTLALGMPANERMDTLVEKATELGVAAIQPLVCERSVLRIAAERARKKVDHWRAVAVAAAEQSGRTRVPAVAEVFSLRDWLAGPGRAEAGPRYLLSLRGAPPFDAACSGAAPVFLSGPEGGLTGTEEALAEQAGFAPRSLGLRTLRADTAPLAVLAALALR